MWTLVKPLEMLTWYLYGFHWSLCQILLYLIEYSPCLQRLFIVGAFFIVESCLIVFHVVVFFYVLWCVSAIPVDVISSHRASRGGAGSFKGKIHITQNKHVLLLDSTITWLFYFTWHCYYMLLLNSSIPWLCYYLTLLLLDSAIRCY